jgi:hypothetical protein
MTLRREAPEEGAGAVPGGSVAELKAACGPFLGASPACYDEAAPDGALSAAALAALPALRVLMEAQAATLAERAAAAAGIASLLERGRGSAQAVALLTTPPGEDGLCARCWAAMPWDLVGRMSASWGADEARLAAAQAGITVVGFRGLGLVGHSEPSHRMWDHYYAQV